MSLLEKTQTLIRDYNFSPSEENGANFLIDERTIEKEVQSAELNENDIVLEIGSGFGYLTEQIAKKSKVIAIEKDVKLFSYLVNKFELNQHVILINGDFLDLIPPRFTKVVSNPPYIIVDRILNKLSRYEFDSGVMILPNSLSETILIDGKETRFSFILKKFFDFEYIMDVPKEYFFPSPRVKSQMLKLSKKPRDIFNFVLSMEDSLVKNALLSADQLFKKDTKRESREWLSDIASDKSNKRLLEIKDKPIKTLNLAELKYLCEFLQSV